MYSEGILILIIIMEMMVGETKHSNLRYDHRHDDNVGGSLIIFIPFTPAILLITHAHT